MGIADKAQNKAEDLGGKAKEAAGSATGDRDLENEGKGDQVKSAVKDAGEKVKDGRFQHQGQAHVIPLHLAISATGTPSGKVTNGGVSERPKEHASKACDG